METTILPNLAVSFGPFPHLHMPALWLATHYHAPDTCAIAVGQSAKEAANLLAIQFPGTNVFLVAPAFSGKVYLDENTFTSRYVARRSNAGELKLTPLKDGMDVSEGFDFVGLEDLPSSGSNLVSEAALK